MAEENVVPTEEAENGARVARVDKPDGSVVEIVYVAPDGSTMPTYVEVRCYDPDPATDVSVTRVDIPQDGKRYNAYVQENAADHVIVRLQPFN